MRHRILIAGLLLLGIGLQQCAMVSNGSRREVSIKSYTDNARIFIDGKLRGTDSVIANLRRGDDHLVEIKKAGCKTYKEPIKSSVHPGYLASYIYFFWFPPAWLGFLTDVISGAWCQLEPVFVGTELTCQEKPK